VVRPLSFIFIGIVLTIQLASTTNGQEKLRAIRDARQNSRSAPIEIVGREVGGKAFAGRQDVAGPGWLEDLTLTIKNVSAKNIKSIEIMLLIPKQGAMENMSGFSYPFPQGEVVSDSKGNLSFGPATQLILKPDATVKLRAWPHQVRILDVLKKLGVTDIAEVEIGIMTVTFDDGTGWLTGVPAVEDPRKPGSLFIVKP
jgi:hypothetical protein